MEINTCKSCLGKECVEAQDELPVALEQLSDLSDDAGGVDPESGTQI